MFFIVSGIGKVIDTTGFSMLIAQYGFKSLMVFSPLIVLAEILLGFLLVLLVNPKRDSMLSCILLIVFTIAFTYAHFANGVNDCGCFGTIQPSNTPFFVSILRNIILIGMCVFIWWKYPKEESKLVFWKKVTIIIVMSISIFIAGLTFQFSVNPSSSENNHAFKNKDLRETELRKYIKTSKDSTYLVFCFSYNCPHCINSIQNFRHFKETNTVDGIIAIVTGNPKEEANFNKKFQPDFPILTISLPEMQKITDAFPTAFLIKNDSIKSIIEGELPSPFVFTKSNSELIGK